MMRFVRFAHAVFLLAVLVTCRSVSTSKNLSALSHTTEISDAAGRIADLAKHPEVRVRAIAVSRRPDLDAYRPRLPVFRVSLNVTEAGAEVLAAPAPDAFDAKGFLVLSLRHDEMASGRLDQARDVSLLFPSRAQDPVAETLRIRTRAVRLLAAPTPKVIVEVVPDYSAMAHLSAEHQEIVGDQDVFFFVIEPVPAAKDFSPLPFPAGEERRFSTVSNFIQQLPRSDWPASFSVSADFPVEYRSAIEKAFAYWNNVCGCNMLRFTGTAVPVEDHELTTNVVRWAPSGRAYGSGSDAHFDDSSGRIIGSSTIQLVEESELKARKYGYDVTMFYLASVLAHEIGHLLGFGHNFATPELGFLPVPRLLSLWDMILRREKLPSPPEKIANSVMAYFSLQPGTIVGHYVGREGFVLPYDKEIFDYIYNQSGTLGSESFVPDLR